MYLGLKQSRNNTTVDILENFNKVVSTSKRTNITSIRTRLQKRQIKKKKLNLQYVTYYQSVNVFPFVFGKHLI